MSPWPISERNFELCSETDKTGSLRGTEENARKVTIYEQQNEGIQALDAVAACKCQRASSARQACYTVVDGRGDPSAFWTGDLPHSLDFLNGHFFSFGLILIVHV